MLKSLYKIDLRALCNSIDLGSLKSKPESIQGGLLNKMFKIETSKGTYAVKAINPQIMLRDTAMKNYIFSEKVANIACENGIPALPALIVDGKSIHEINGQFYLVFSWFDGKSFPSSSIDVRKCEITGKLLAKIHNLDFSSEIDGTENNLELHSIDWNNYIELAKKKNVEWLNLIVKNSLVFADLEEKANKSHQKLFINSVISHRDLDQKNVLWDSLNSPMIIDWESAGFVNPSMELLDVATYWSGGESGTPNEQAFKLIIKSYCKNGGIIKDDINDVFNSSFIGKLGWLEYSVKRSLRIECNDDSEQLLGTEQVISTIDSINDYKKTIPILFKWFTEVKTGLYC